MRFTTILAVLGVLLFAESARPQGGDPALRSAVERYLTTVEEDAADEVLRDIVARADVTAQRLLEIIRERPSVQGRSITVTVPHAGRGIRIELRIPPGHDESSKPLPVLLDITEGVHLDRLTGGARIIGVAAHGYTPPQFSDEGRDGFAKILRTAAHRANGDPDRLWATGFSWAGHATCDNALHRPGLHAGIAPLGGGPRRIHFRLLDNLAGTTVLAWCGAKDDPELVWNLRELALRARKHHYRCKVTFDPDKGHRLPLADVATLGRRITEAAPLAPLADRGRLLADGRLVENPLLRIDAVEERRVRVPRLIPVPSSLSYDGKRRATIRAMRGQVVWVAWTIKRARRRTTISLKSRGVTRCTLFLRAPAFKAGDRVRVRAGAKTVFDGPLRPEPRVLLEETRRTGERLRPAIARLAIAF